MGNAIEITLIGKPGCHLCDDARVALAGVLDGFRAEHPSVILNVTEKNILDDPALAAAHSEEIPVVLINGKMHSYWRVDPGRLVAKLESLIQPS